MEQGLEASPTNEVLIEESVLGWKEFEMEVVRDRADNRPSSSAPSRMWTRWAIHTGDSITVAPCADADRPRNISACAMASIAVLREIGVETGGIECAIRGEPERRPHGRDRDEPARVRAPPRWRRRRRASRLPRSRRNWRAASTLDELENDITKATPASFEPAID
ncbi:MAG: hypothetical protein WDM89_04550 [Rhizomicrobium sp.]